MTKFFYLFLLLNIVCHHATNAQRNVQKAEGQGTFRIVNSHLKITESNQPVPLYLSGGNYNPAKNNLPYYLLTQETTTKISAKPKLSIKTTLPVNASVAAILSNRFGSFITESFELEDASGNSGHSYFNTYRLIPIRRTANGSYEELIEYSIEWETTPRPIEDQSNVQKMQTAGSVLASGKWYKIGLSKSGIYKIDKSLLSKMGVDVRSINPRHIRLYGNGGKSLPLLTGSFRHNDLQENTIEVVGEEDNVFNDHDYILFYANGYENWKYTAQSASLKFNYTTNYASDSAFYFLNFDLGAGKRFHAGTTLAPSMNLQHQNTTSSYDFYTCHEVNTVNFLKSGREFYGEYFDINTSYTFNFQAQHLVINDTVRVVSNFIVRADNANIDLSVLSNGYSKTGQFHCSGIGGISPSYGAEAELAISYLNNTPSNISITLSKTSGNGTVAWLDKVIVNARRQLTYTNQQFNFRDERINGNGKISLFNLSIPVNVSSIKIWNVSNPINPLLQNYEQNGINISFKAASDSLQEYVIFRAEDALIPEYKGPVQNQNLHGLNPANYLIVCPPAFIPLANRLASLHLQNENISTHIVTPLQIYNEFSSGRTEATAIRDFAHFLYTKGKNTNSPLKYLLLMGDGSYINKEWYKSNNSAVLPTFQVKNSLSTLGSVVTDDFYGLLDPSDGEEETYTTLTGKTDIGVGRFPVRTYQEAEGIVQKIEQYYQKNPNYVPQSNQTQSADSREYSFGDWRQNITYLADDEDGAQHMVAANSVASLMETQHPQYNNNRILLDAYQQISTPGGQRYPDAQSDLQNSITKGTLVLSYHGHGGEVGLTAERLLDIPMINAWNNTDRLPLFYTATCEFSRFDDPDRTSAGELCLLNPSGGAVSMITTARLAYADFGTFNTILFQYLFKKLPDGTFPTIGEALRKAKATAGNNYSTQNIHLLGDPALTLAYPRNSIKTINVNNKDINLVKDTLSGLEKVTITGEITDSTGNRLNSFNGIIYSTLFDKKEDVTCLVNDQSSLVSTTSEPLRFQQQKSILFRGKASVKAGLFTFSFLMPKDINPAYGLGKISYYAHNGKEDAGGYSTNVIIGGIDTGGVKDLKGPSIDLFMNDLRFVKGGTTDENPLLLARLFDESGITISANGIGHEITAILDERSSNPIILNSFFDPELDNYQSGQIRYPLKKLSKGLHTLSLKAWDTQNNSSLSQTEFIVAEKAELALKHVLNYPNPFSTHTSFFFEHNQGKTPLEVSIDIFTISGKRLKTIKQSIYSDTFRPEGIAWDGRDEFGDKLAKGVYIYKFRIQTDKQNTEVMEKLVILN